MDTKELSSVQALKSRLDHEYFENDDPNICSWNKKRYPDLKPIARASNHSSHYKRSLHMSCPRAGKTELSKKDPCYLSICSPVCNTPQIRSLVAAKPFSSKKVAYRGCNTNSCSPDLTYIKDFQDPSKTKPKYFEHLNNLALKKLKANRTNKEKSVSGEYGFGFNSRVFEILNGVNSPGLEIKKTPFLQNKLPLTTAQTLEELLKFTKVKKINKKYLKYKL